MKSPNYVAVLAILNAMLRHVTVSLPQLEEATRGLLHEFPSIPDVSVNGTGKVNLS
jgi:hypothetical protein